MAGFFSVLRQKLSGVGAGRTLCWNWEWIIEIFGVAGVEVGLYEHLWLMHSDNEGHSATRGVGRVQHGGRLALAHQQPLEQRTAGRYKGLLTNSRVREHSAFLVYNHVCSSAKGVPKLYHLEKFDILLI